MLKCMEKTGRKTVGVHKMFYICSAQCKNPDNSGIVLRKVGIPTLSTDSGIVPDNSRTAQGIHVVLWSDMVSAQSRNMRG